MPVYPACYVQVCSLLREVGHLTSVSSLVSWDQETYMPPKAAASRAEQSSLLAGITHERRTSKRLGDLIGQCEADDTLMRPGSETAANIREIRRDYDRSTKLPGDLVTELAKVGSQSQEVWKVAREKNDWGMFEPWLERMMELTRRKADCYGIAPGGEVYDALLDEYEPGATAAMIEGIFTPLRSELSTLLRRVVEKGTPPSEKPLKLTFDADRQHKFGQFVLASCGFDLAAGRLDVTTHPFCSGLGAGDTRLTTRYREERFTDALYGTLHEMGHGLYEQGLPKDDHFGEPLSGDISLGIHESQSRMWENFVGRSKSFWKWAHPHAKKYLGKDIGKFTSKEFFAAVNTAKPSLIRVEADEATYNMHVMIRFEIERALMSGTMKVKDVPAEWNRRYKEYLNVKVPDDRRGCLQDVHWSFGLIGYFPTYTLGNLYCAQFWDKITSDLPDLQKEIAKGKFGDLKRWLNEKIHKHGRRYRAGDLCKKVTGKELSSAPLMAHLTQRAQAVYGID
jgi:carboxypeptidase Taq